jgi:hypothetical protein
MFELVELNDAAIARRFVILDRDRSRSRRTQRNPDRAPSPAAPSGIRTIVLVAVLLACGHGSASSTTLPGSGPPSTASSPDDPEATADGAGPAEYGGVVGSVAPEEIRRVIRSHASEIRGCLEQHREIHPRERGKITLNWRIMPDGSVSSVSVARAGTTMCRALADCFARRVMTFKFPRPTTGEVAMVEYPWTLRIGTYGP